MDSEAQAQAHRFFSAHCFNGAWDLMDKQTRTSQENLAMEHMAQASLWHWLQREDRTATHLSVGYWQLSRVYALLKQADNSLRFAEHCLEVSQSGQVEPFYLGYAYEALARATVLAGNRLQAEAFLSTAQTYLQKVEDVDHRQALELDLASVMNTPC